METYQTINEYVATQMSDKIARKAMSPLLGILILAIGITMLVMLRTLPMDDVLMSTCLTLGIIALCVGIVLTALCLTKTLWHYVYFPTHSRMKQCKYYLSNTDYQITLEAIRDKKLNLLASLPPIVSSNSALDILYSRDLSIALVQAGRYDSGHFEPETAPMQVSGKVIAKLV